MGCPYCRFFRKVRYEEGCWRWTGTKDKNGYGYIHTSWDSVKRRSRSVQAHRFSWTYLVGCIDRGKHIYHLCHNQDCVRPDHLAQGTQSDHSVDWRSEWRRKGKTVLTAKQYLWRANEILYKGNLNTIRRSVGLKRGG